MKACRARLARKGYDKTRNGASIRRKTAIPATVQFG